MASNNPTTNHFQYLKGGGEMGTLMRAYDWSANVLGPVDFWPQSLLTTLSIIVKLYKIGSPP